MADIDYTRQHDLPLAKAKKIAQETADDLGKQYELVSEWASDTLHFHRSGVTGQMDVSAVQIVLKVELSFPLSMLKDTFERNIKKYIDERLAEAKPAARTTAKPAVKKATKPTAKKATRRA